MNKVLGLNGVETLTQQLDMIFLPLLIIISIGVIIWWTIIMDKAKKKK